ncbi:phage tail protein [Stutzerimonas kirkiae]|uniref:phage tail protein n=1 Tax=Stutzerimonas kirkiae TaxID=2211392 RepID=UPI00103844B2|nr:phage tail protein [Stutzerimonas kirkiae]TBV10264.1 hypothetical protein DNK08_07235 [Stutzerimonas kirkiae]
MFAVLGKIELDVAGGLSGMEYRGSATWAEHALVSGKPLLEWVGDALDEYDLTITLHAGLGDPDERLRALREAKAGHQPLAFVLGSGDFLGRFVITNLGNSVRRTTSDGRLHAASLSLALREYTGQVKDASPKLGLATASTRDGATQVSLQTQTSVPLSTAGQVLAHARSAGNILVAARDVYTTARNGSPAAALNRVPSLLGMTGRALEPLQNFSSAAGLLANGADLVTLGGNVLEHVRQARLALDPVDTDTVIDQVTRSGSSVAAALDLFDAASTRLAKLAGAVITRTL